MPTPKIRHDWYQTETHVFINILTKNAENVKVHTSEIAVSKHFTFCYRYNNIFFYHF